MREHKESLKRSEALIEEAISNYALIIQQNPYIKGIPIKLKKLHF